MCGFVPCKGYLGETSLFVVVVVALVLVEGECAVCARVDAYFEVVPVVLLAVLHIGPPRDDGALTNVERHKCQINVTRHLLSAFVLLT